MKLYCIAAATLLATPFVAAQAHKKVRTCPAVPGGDEYGPCDETSDQIKCNEVEDHDQGAWTHWTAWTPLTNVEGNYVTRQRACQPTGICGTRCKGKSSEISSCQNDGLKPIDGAWSDWSTWGATSVWGEWISAASSWSEWTTSEAGSSWIGLQSERMSSKQQSTMTRTRTCASPPPDCGGRQCVGKDYQTRTCSTCVA